MIESNRWLFWPFWARGYTRRSMFIRATHLVGSIVSTTACSLRIRESGFGYTSRYRDTDSSPPEMNARSSPRPARWSVRLDGPRASIEFGGFQAS